MTLLNRVPLLALMMLCLASPALCGEMPGPPAPPPPPSQSMTRSSTMLSAVIRVALRLIIIKV